ncbi:MAG: ATP-binding cassette domain-containing protein [Candidatus Dependentiae bacterium]|nr:ATP-binding cassette domain-containing protein [Candidatus Dependentiae bacterium]
MINVYNLTLAFGTQTIFDHLSFNLDQHQRIGLVGANGSGKSTLLKVLTDTQNIDDGKVVIAKGRRLAYLPQEVVLNSPKSILDETFSTFDHIQQLQDEADRLEHTLHENPHNLERYTEIHDQLADMNIERARAETKRMLTGLGFSEKQFNEPVSSLSVGWKMRVVLAKLLLQKADFYLFDEPTNHLDITAQDWFLNFLKQAHFGFLLICHERYFLDQLCDHILDLERGQGTLYTGNYAEFEKQKEHNLELLHAAFQTQQKEIKQKQETINRFRATASKAKMAQSMMKALDKVERVTIPPSRRTINFKFPPIERAGNVVLTVKDVAQSFDNKEIFKNVSFEVLRGSKVAIIASNGVGKTTLFNVITGKYPLQKGEITFGHNVSFSLFDQDQNATLDLEATVFDNIRARVSQSTEQDIRTFLGSFLFTNEDVKKKVKVLSGGEKNRVGMTSVLLQKANLLLLDEPTNHLDIASKEVLLKALKDYLGTIVFVSHDRDFVNKLATHIIELTPTGVISYQGDYDGYLYYKNNILNHPQISSTVIVDAEPAKKKVNPKHLKEINKKIGAVERKVHNLEKDIKEVEYSFAELRYGSSEFTSAEQKLQTLKNELKEQNASWEKLQAELHELQN